MMMNTDLKYEDNEMCFYKFHVSSIKDILHWQTLQLMVAKWKNKFMNSDMNNEWIHYIMTAW